jgi:hypothetical protein
VGQSKSLPFVWSGLRCRLSSKILDLGGKDTLACCISKFIIRVKSFVEQARDRKGIKVAPKNENLGVALTRNKDRGQTLVSRTKPGQNFQLLMLACVYAMHTDENVYMCVYVCVCVYIYTERAWVRIGKL